MTTSLNINEALLKEALALDNQVNIDSLVETALREYIQRRKRLKVLARISHKKRKKGGQKLRKCICRKHLSSYKV